MISFFRRHWTIRTRLTAVYGGLFLLAGALLLGVTYILVAQRIDERLESDRTLAPILQRRPDQSPTASVPTVRPPDGQQQTVEETIEMLRADQRKLRDDAMESLLTQGGLALAGVGVVAAAFGWLLAGRALRPLQRITETAQRIAGADSAGRGLHERIALSGPRDEILGLADTFDQMLARLDRSFEGQRRFVASASHEMRTPLAINQALIEVAVTRPTASADAKELGAALLESNERHKRLIDGLLTLADSENEVIERRRLDLGEVTRHVLATAAGAARQAGVEIRPADLGQALSSGDPYLIERLVQNLVENAIKHNLPASGWLSARTWSEPQHAHLQIANSGSAVPQYQIDAIFEPFRRMNNKRTGSDRGFGLGLSIVRAVAIAHGGAAHGKPGVDGGLVITVTLPRAD